jgi:hypothetical protein
LTFVEPEFLSELDLSSSKRIQHVQKTRHEAARTAVVSEVVVKLDATPHSWRYRLLQQCVGTSETVTSQRVTLL